MPRDGPGKVHSLEGYIGALVALLSGLVFLAVGWPLMRGRIGPNPLYGFRIRATLRDERIWYPVNQRGGRHFVIIGAVQVALGVLGLIYLGDERLQRDLVIVTLAAIAGGLIYSVAVCVQMAKQMDRQLHGSGQDVE